ncbi:MAG: DUF547 domain-containing protein [Thermodesulfobacteriota bacterium]|nr:DUF547 domain-containing protein [Thermodesulfobacteriota bacterium]
MLRIFADYVDKAKDILDGNWTGSYTKPAPSLYPHQWNWDSGFIAMGRSHYDTRRAILEIETLFDAQWQNGMVPQIVFNPDALGGYFPEPDFWQTERCSKVPPGKLTSGITMPPVHAIAVEKIYRNARRPRTVLPFLERIYPKLLSLHRYLYRERDPKQEGLVYIRHPWESGIDNSPTWDDPLRKISVDRAALPPYQRKDLEHGIDPGTRPTDADYDRYVHLVDLFRQCDYDEAKIRETCPFLIQDPLFNAVLCRANESLAEIAGIINESPELPISWAKKTAGAIREKLWHGEHQIFDAFDLVANEPIEVDTAAGFLPLYAGAASREQAELIYQRLDSTSFCALQQGNCFTVPNYDTQKEGFARSNYWRGPVWININWMLAHGLRRYGYTLKADSLQKDLLQLPLRFGFYEYFDSFEGTGYGSDNFGWTAALFIDLVHDFYEGKKASQRVAAKARGLFSLDVVLNSGEKMPDLVAPWELAGALMRSIRGLRDAFYDTTRGRVDYEALRQSYQYVQYRLLTNGLRRFDLSRLVGRRDKLAFWVNLYNTIVVDGIVSLNIKRSVQEAPELFSRVKYAIGEDLFSADDMEHGMLRGNARPWLHLRRQFGPADPRKAWLLKPSDPRIHFALVCGSRSCAPIDYYDAATIYGQLEEAAKSFVNSSEVIVLPDESKVLLSEIFRWYESDFGGKRGVLDFLCDYLADDHAREAIQETAENLRFEYIYYDWDLNC